MVSHAQVRLTANFALNLERIGQFLNEHGASPVFESLLDAITHTLIPNLEKFPALGRNFADRPAGSLEVGAAKRHLRKQLSKFAKNGELREYLLGNYLILYAWHGADVYLISIKHHRQLSFDFTARWIP